MTKIYRVISVALIITGMFVMSGAQTFNSIFFLGGIMALVGVVHFMTLFFFDNAKKVDEWMSK